MEGICVSPAGFIANILAAFGLQDSSMFMQSHYELQERACRDCISPSQCQNPDLVMRKPLTVICNYDMLVF